MSTQELVYDGTKHRTIKRLIMYFYFGVETIKHPIVFLGIMQILWHVLHKNNTHI